MRPRSSRARLTKAPNPPSTVPSHPTSWGEKAEDVADWLKNKPDSVGLDANHFPIVDKRVEKDGTVVICKSGAKSLKGTKLDYLRFSAAEAALHLGGMEYDTREGFNPDGEMTAKIEYYGNIFPA